MKLTRRILAVVLCITLALTVSLVGCGKGNSSGDDTNLFSSKDDSARVIFDEEIKADGMEYEIKGGKLDFGEMLGKEYAKIKKGTSINFKLSKNLVKKLANKPLYIKLEYYESNSKSFKISYKKEKGSAEEILNMSGTTIWGGYSLKIDDIKLTEDAKHHFTISLGTATSMWLRSVEVCENKNTMGTYPKLLKTDYLTSNGKIIEANVKDYGAVGDGKTDDSMAFQTALRDMEKKGGALYVPAGKYKITQDIVIPSGVTLLGDFNRPSRENPKAKGTILATYTPTIADGNKSKFITLKAGSCVKGLTIWYPEQDLASGEAEPYNYTIGICENIGTTIEDIYLVNSYMGISHKNGDSSHYQEMIKNIYGTPLHTGYMAGKASDSDKHQFFDFSPKFWLGSGLGNVPKESVLKEWLLTYGTGFSLGDIDFHYVSDINIEGYKVGMHVRGLYGRIYNFNITDCNVCMYIDGAVIYGGQLSKGVLKANGGKNPVAMLVGESVNTGFTGTSIEMESTGDYALNYLGNGQMALQDCKFTVTGKDSIAPLHSAMGKVSIINSVFNGGKNDVVFDETIDKSCLVNCSGTENNLRIKNSATDKLTVENSSENKVISLDSEALKKADERRQYQIKMPKTQKLYPITNYGVKSDKENPMEIGDAVQKAIDEAAANGGGIVYIPAGDYRLEKPITVKSGVELTGSNDYFHYVLNSLNYSTLLTDYGNGNEKATPLITIEANAGVRGLTIVYDKISQETIKPYATTIQGKGADAYLINTTVVGGYYIADFDSYKCDNHYIESVNFFTFGTGIGVGGGSENGVLLNGHSNPGEMWATGYNTNKWSPDWEGPLMTYLHTKANSFYFGKSKNQVSYMTATFGTQYGIKIDDGADVYIIGHGTDYSINGIRITGNSNAVIIDPQCIGTYHSEPYTSTAIVADNKFSGNATVYNLCAWNIHDASVRVDGKGKFTLHGGTFLETGKSPLIATGGDITMTGAIVYGRSQGDLVATDNTKSVTAFGNVLKFSPKFMVDGGIKSFGTDLK